MSRRDEYFERIRGPGGVHNQWQSFETVCDILAEHAEVLEKLAPPLEPIVYDTHYIVYDKGDVFIALFTEREGAERLAEARHKRFGSYVQECYVPRQEPGGE